MPLNKEEFKKAFREVMDSEFENIPKNELDIDYTFSEEFNRKTDKLIKAQKKPYYVIINTMSKRVAVVFLTVVTTIVAILTFNILKEPISTLPDGSSSDTSSQTSSQTQSSEESKPKKDIPSDLKEVVSSADKTEEAAIYEDKKGNTVILTKAPTTEEKVDISSKSDGVVNVEMVDNLEIVVVDYEYETNVIWVNDGYYCQVTAYGNVEKETLDQFVEAVK